MMRPATKGPRSLMRTMVQALVSVRVTMTQVPKGSVLWAAVKSYMLKGSPLAVVLPCRAAPYQEAFPRGASSRSVLTLQRLETCSQLIPGKNIIDFDPSSIGSKPAKVKGTPTPEPEVEAEPVDE